MKAAVFGGSGFLGSYVVDELIGSGHSVRIFDINPPRNTELISNYRPINVLDRSAIMAAIASFAPDVIYNFSGLADINICKNKPYETMETNILGYINILEAIKCYRPVKIIYASSAYAFSNKGSFYGISKQAAERITEEFHQRYDIPFVIIRYGSLYGERADSSNGVYRFLHEALTKRKITYIGSGDEVREFIHCRDAASLSVQVLDKAYENKHFILTGVERLRITEFLHMVAEIIGPDVKVCFEDANYDAHYKVTPYTFMPPMGTKLVNNPYIDLGQGLLECIAKIHRKATTSEEKTRISAQAQLFEN